MELQMIPNWEEQSLHWSTVLLVIKTLNHFVSLKNGVNEIEEVGNDVKVDKLGWHKQNTHVSFQPFASPHLRLWSCKFYIK